MALLNLLGGSLGEGLNLIFQIFKPFNSSFSTFLNPRIFMFIFKIRLGFISIHYIFPNTRNCTGTKIYKKLKQGSM